MSLLPLISRALAGSPESIGLLLLSLCGAFQGSFSLPRLLPFVSSHHKHSLLPTISHASSLILSPNTTFTCRLLDLQRLVHIFTRIHTSAPALHIIAIPSPCTTLLFPRICHPEIAACDDPTSLWPTQSPPPPLVRPDDRRIVYFITAQ
jgi:hypothetical protein